MKLVTYSDGSKAKIGVVKNEGLIDLSRHLPELPADMIGLMTEWDGVRLRIQTLAEKAPGEAPLSGVHLLAPIPRPGKILAIGLNYADHIKESGQPTPEHQTWFSKAVTSVTGPFDPIELPQASKLIDYEAELVVIIGKRCKHVPKERAAEVVFGYCAGNDVSVRDWQMRTTQWGSASHSIPTLRSDRGS
jgi:2-keto-4-pentenoate hydratase/2-oxohepta-3-ene-1,7-dioic acid hydratase in catechol pathway